MICKSNFCLLLIYSIFCVSCSTEPIDLCDYEHDDISYNCIQDIFDFSCTTYNCHAVGGNVPNLSYGVSYNNIINKTATWDDNFNYIEPYSPQTSLLYQQLEQSVAENRYFMPQNGNKLSQAKRDYIQRWILDGAPFN